MFKSCCVVLAAVLLAACGVPNARDETPHAAPPAVAAAGNGAGAAGTVASTETIPKAPTGPGVYSIDPTQSEIRLLVYRAGVMATLGHNHVIINRSLSGWIQFTGDPTAASFALALPVADFIVDDVGARGLEGGDFLEEIPEDAKEGTRRNMLSAALLDVDHYPTITLRSVSVTPHAGTMDAKVIVRVAGHESTLVVPVLVATSAAQISATGSIQLRQTSLGLKPFSILMGSLKVQDEMTLSFTLVATIT